jgi:hypothetical protein
VVLHAVVVMALVLHRPAPVQRTVRFIEIGERGTELAYQPPRGARGPEITPPARAASPAPPVPAPPPGPVIAAEPVPPAAGSANVPPARDSVVVDTRRRLAPAYGDGRLWVRVGEDDEATAGALAARGAFDVAGHVAMVDSAMAARIRTWLDTVPADSFATRPAPKWTTEIAGQTWGVDGQWIHLGPIKIPTAVLAALPIPSGNYDEAKRAELLRYMRQDILQAAMRAKTTEDFNRYVKELRERNDVERAARVPPPPPRDTLVP